MPGSYYAWRLPCWDSPQQKVGRPKRDRSKNRSQHRARKASR